MSRFVTGRPGFAELLLQIETLARRSDRSSSSVTVRKVLGLHLLQIEMFLSAHCPDLPNR